MKAFRIILTVLVVALISVSCTKKQADTGDFFDYEMLWPWVESDPDFTNIWAATDTEVTYKIKCSRNWTCKIRENYSWVKDYTKSGSVGESTLTVHIDPNTTHENRVAYLDFYYDNVETYVFLEQEGIAEEDED